MGASMNKEVAEVGVRGPRARRGVVNRMMGIKERLRTRVTRGLKGGP